MRRRTTRVLILAFAAILFCADAGANEGEAELIKVLQSDAAPPAKDGACQKLKVVGTAKAVPALASLLADPALSHSARYALEGIAAPEAGVALREALKDSSGLTKAGIVASLGQRRDRGSVDALKELVRDADEPVAVAAAAALGRIGGAEALGALRAARSNAPKSMTPVLLDAMLACADGMLAGGFRPDAVRVYREVHELDDAPEAARTAAYRGLVLAAGDNTVELIEKALTGTDRAEILASLRLVGELEGAAAAFAALIPKVRPEVRVALIDSLAQRGDPAAAPAIAAAAKDGQQETRVRVAALRALGVLGDASVVPLLATKAAGEAGAERDAARQALATLKGDGVREAIVDLAGGSDAKMRVEMIRALGQRYDRGTGAVLLEWTNDRDEPVRAAAFQSLAMVGSDEAVGPLVRRIGRAGTEPERGAAERTLRAVASRVKNPEQAARAVAVGLAVADPSAAAALLRVCAAIDTPGALAALREGTRSVDPVVAESAVRAMAALPNPAAAGDLLSIAKNGTDENQRVLALRGVVRLVDEARDMTPQARAALLKDALPAAGRVEEKRLVLGALGRTPGVEALAVVESVLGDGTVAEEAGVACLQIAKGLVATHPHEARAACEKLLATGANEKLAAEARALRERIGER